MADDIGRAWGLPGVLGFFDTARSTTEHVYASEWLFLRDRLRTGMSVLDVGCAQGGFVSVLAEHLRNFSYTGLDVSEAMVERARHRHPTHTFHHVHENQPWPLVTGQTYDLVLVLGILHLHMGWRQTLHQAWNRTGSCLLMDLREIPDPTVEDPARSYFRMDFGGGDRQHEETHLPYILVNSAEALSTVQSTCADARRISHYGYVHPVSGSAVTPQRQVMANVWCAER